jgi:hypothetical protein
VSRKHVSFKRWKVMWISMIVGYTTSAFMRLGSHDLVEEGKLFGKSPYDTAEWDHRLHFYSIVG